MRIRAAIISLAFFLWAAPLGAWGVEVHRRLTARAVDVVPEPLSSFLDAERDFVSEHSVDPDLWRVVDLRGRLGAEGPNHYLNLDQLDEPRPFAGVPRDRQAFVTRYGSRRAEDAGRLPWRAAEIHALLVRAFRDVRPGGPPYAAANARYLSAVLSHYVADAYVPFHATANHDGQLTNQQGIHSRFETRLAMRYVDAIAPARIRTSSPRSILALTFDALVASEALAPRVLEADRNAAGGRRRYDAAYDSAFSRAAGPVVRDQMTAAVRGIAESLLSAWQEAGRPSLAGS